MGYEIAAGADIAVLDEHGNPLTISNVAGEGAGPPFGSSSTAAQIVDDGTGALVAHGNFPGTALFGFVRDGSTIEHSITVTAAPFDWTLADPA